MQAMQPIQQRKIRLMRKNLTLAILLSVGLSGCIDTEFETSANMSKQPTNTVSTEQGVLEGTWSKTDPDIGVFRGVAYAQPPVGELRWREPQDLASWRGVRQAQEFGAACWQSYSEDAFVWSRGEIGRASCRERV